MRNDLSRVQGVPLAEGGIKRPDSTKEKKGQIAPRTWNAKIVALLIYQKNFALLIYQKRPDCA